MTLPPSKSASTCLNLLPIQQIWRFVARFVSAPRKRSTPRIIFTDEIAVSPAMPDQLYILAKQGKVQVLELHLPLHLDVITFDDLNTSLNTIITSNPGDYVLDLSNTDYVGSAVLGLLVNLRTKVRKSGGRLVLCRLSPRILEIFRVGSLESLFTISPTREAAIDLLR